ncbi:MAG TPA: hypothetical protein VK615_00750 [Candidatus Binatia bacterium]|nr:hypothetical protein [Candidatus Binatia bacterium]
MAVLWVHVMACMMTRRLKHPDALKKGNERTVFSRRAMRPFMDLIGIATENCKQPYAPGENTAEPGFGIGLSVRIPQKKFSPTVRVIDLPDFPPVRLGALYRSGANSNSTSKVCRAFLQEVGRQAARLSHKTK